MCFQQLSGINGIMFNAQDIFLQGGFRDPNTPSVIVAAVQVAATALSVLLIDRLGRRLLLLASGAVVTLSCVAYGVYDYLYSQTPPVAITPLALGSVITYVAGFSIGWGPIPWIIMSEVFPVRARGLASGLANLCNWSCGFLVTNQFENLESLMTVYGVFWMFAGFNFAGIVFVAVFLPETKGRSLEDIERVFLGDGNLAVDGSFVTQQSPASGVQ